MALLASVAANFGHRHALHSDLDERIFDSVEFRGLNYRFEFRHGLTLSGCKLHSLPALRQRNFPGITFFAMLREVEALHFFLG